METNAQTLRQRKMLLVLPALAIPFITLFFWSLGGGQATALPLQDSTAQKGLNTHLPEAQLSKETPDKFSLYQLAAKDSASRLKQQLMDSLNNPLKEQGASGQPVTDDSAKPNSQLLQASNSPGYRGKVAADPNEAKVQNKLAELQSHLNQSMATKPANDIAADSPASGDPATTKSLDRLEAMMQSMKTDSSDPEMQQLSGMLDKIMEVQHPELVREKIRAQSEKNRGQAFPVSLSGNEQDGSLMNGNDAGNRTDTLRPPTGFSFTQGNGFYDLDEDRAGDQGNAIPAVVQETQTLVSGATVKMRLLEDLFVAGHLIPKDNFIYGTCSLEGERLNIDIKSIRYQQAVYPVALRVYDQDGLTGVYVPGAISRDAAKQGADQAIQGMDIYSMNSSVGAQAASAGIQAAKGLFSKKVKLVKVTIKAGYNVLLVNANQTN